MSKRIGVGIALVGLLVSACAVGEVADSESDSADATTSTTTVEPTLPESEDTQDTPSSPSTTAGEIDPGLQPLIDLAIADLSKRLEIDAAEISVLDARLVTWPDSSMGCPEPGRVYLPVVADGSVIELAADDTVYSYHTGGDIYEPFLCEEPSGKEGAASGSDPLAGTPLELDKPIEKYPEKTVPPPGYDE